MDSIVPECTELKQIYEKCFNEWFTEFLKDGRSTSPTPCDKLFKDYQQCCQPKLQEIKDKLN